MPKNPLACSECHLIIPDEKKSGPYSHKKKKELVEDLESRGLSKDGKVEDLVHRLIQNDFDQKNLSELVTELSELNPTADTDCEKDELISKLMKETTKKYQPKCIHHPDSIVSPDWSGYVVIMDPSRSEIANRLNIEIPGNYALKVNIR
tara:strand:- start:506 stop:952 length:447 start_codon:yes stop_codon:yes gene_type:complete